MIDEVKFKVDNGHCEVLRGHLHYPDGRSEAVPGVVIIPGFADTAVGPHNLHVSMARALVQIGCAVLRFDYRGQGESDGDFRNFTAQSGLADAHAALDILRAQTYVDPARLGLIGFSLGGTLACELAASYLQIRALSLLAPVAYPQAVFPTFFTAQHLEQADKQGWMDWLGWAVGREYLSSLDALDPLAALRCSNASTLVIHGRADTEVPPENGTAFATSGATLHWLEHGDHQFSSVLLQEEAIKRVSAWFQLWL